MDGKHHRLELVQGTMVGVPLVFPNPRRNYLEGRFDALTHTHGTHGHKATITRNSYPSASKFHPNLLHTGAGCRFDSNRDFGLDRG